MSHARSHVLVALLAVLAFGLLGPTRASAHAADDDIAAFTTPSAMLARALRNQPLVALAGTLVADPTSEKLTGLLDIVALRVAADQHLTFEITFASATAPDPEAVVINLVREGEVLPALSVLDVEGRGWGLYELDRSTFAYVRVGAASYEQVGNVMRLEISPDDLQTCSYLAYARASGVSDAFEPVFDEAPNNRQGLRVVAGDACAAEL